MTSQTEQKIIDTVNDFVQRGFMFTAFDVTKTIRNDGDRVRHKDVNQSVQNLFSNGDMGTYTRDLVNVGAPVEPWVYYHPYSDVHNYSPDWIENNPDQTGMKDQDDDNDTLTSGSSNPDTDGVDIGGIDDDDEDEEEEDDNSVDGSDDEPSSVSALSALATIASSLTSSATSSPSKPVKKRTNRTMQHGNDDYNCLPSKDGRLHIPKTLISKIADSGCDSVKVEKAIVGLCKDKALVLTATRLGDYKINADGRVRIASKDLNYIDDDSEFIVKLVNNEIWVK